MNWHQQLEPATGPACNRCGCRDSRIVRHPPPNDPWFGFGQAVCKACGHRFAFRKTRQPATTSPPIESQQPPIDATRHHAEPVRPRFQVFICGECRSKCKVSYSRNGVRTYKCSNKDCGKTYKIAGEDTVELH